MGNCGKKQYDDKTEDCGHETAEDKRGVLRKTKDEGRTLGK